MFEHEQWYLLLWRDCTSEEFSCRMVDDDGSIDDVDFSGFDSRVQQLLAGPLFQMHCEMGDLEARAGIVTTPMMKRVALQIANPLHKIPSRIAIGQLPSCACIPFRELLVSCSMVKVSLSLPVVHVHCRVNHAIVKSEDHSRVQVEDAQMRRTW
eukprot:5926832-Amphidinium_carterae.1